ncbi:MAG: response regulator, partial [Alphaproteobacteria bacterium]|nr:response regulator [Alphaproteobacteria bacterium]
RRVVMRQLFQLDYRVEEAHNAVEALRLLESRRPIDLLFTNVEMAGRVGGFDPSRIVAERWPAIRIILTSGFPDAHAGAPATAAAQQAVRQDGSRAPAARAAAEPGR